MFANLHCKSHCRSYGGFGCIKGLNDVDVGVQNVPNWGPEVVDSGVACCVECMFVFYTELCMPKWKIADPRGGRVR